MRWLLMSLISMAWIGTANPPLIDKHLNKPPKAIVNKIDNRKPIQAPLDCLDLNFRATRMGVNLRGKRRCV